MISALAMLSALAGPASVPYPITSRPPVQVTEPAISEAALKLAALLNSEANIIGDDESDAAALALIDQFVAASPDLAALEKEMPGVMLALGHEILPIANRSMRERLNDLHQRQAALYAGAFTRAELDTLIQFYSSPTGSKLISVLMAKVKPTAIVAEASKSEEFKFGEQAVLKDIRATLPDVMRSMTTEDEAVLMRFAQTSAAPKLRALAPQTQKIAIDWMNEEAPWEAAAIDEAIARVMARYEGKRK